MKLNFNGMTSMKQGINKINIMIDVEVKEESTRTRNCDNKKEKNNSRCSQRNMTSTGFSVQTNKKKTTKNDDT